MPIRIGHHGLPAEFVERDVLRRMPRAAGDRQRREHALRIGRGPLQRLHAAHRAADHAEQRVDAEPVDQHGLRAHHVGNGDDRKIQPPQLAGGGIGRGRAGRAHAAADHVRADDEIVVGVERRPGPTMVSHQPGLPVTGCTLATCWSPVSAWQTRMALERVGIEFAVGLIGDLERRKIDAAIELQRLVRAEHRDLRTRMIRLVRAILGMDRRTWYRLHVTILTPTSSGGFEHHRKSGHKKPGLNIGSAGITSCPRPV